MMRGKSAPKRSAGRLTPADDSRPGFRPLYKQVRDLLRGRISAGDWRPAEALPSEQALASELGVSQGTVRKALDTLVAEKIVERRQGKGTFVCQHTKESASFRFIKVFNDDGAQISPTTITTSLKHRPAKRAERERLALGDGAEVYVLSRVRLVETRPSLSESIIVPSAMFPRLEDRQPLPNTLYMLYESAFGVSIARADEQVRAVAAARRDAVALEIDIGAPLLEVDRLAFDMNGAPVEWRRSRFATHNRHYAVSLC